MKRTTPQFNTRKTNPMQFGKNTKEKKKNLEQLIMREDDTSTPLRALYFFVDIITLTKSFVCHIHISLFLLCCSMVEQVQMCTPNTNKEKFVKTYGNQKKKKIEMWKTTKVDIMESLTGKIHFSSHTVKPQWVNISERVGWN